MKPHQELVDNGFCLADPGNEYLVYLENPGVVNLELQPGTYYREWINAQDGNDRRRYRPVQQGNNLSSPKDGDDWLLHLIRRQTE